MGPDGIKRLLYSKGNCQLTEKAAYGMGKKFAGQTPDREVVSEICKGLTKIKKQAVEQMG